MEFWRDTNLQKKNNLNLLMDHLHWQRLLAKLQATVTPDCTCLGHLGRCDIDRIISNSVTLPKVVKASTRVSILRVIVDGVVVLPLPM